MREQSERERVLVGLKPGLPDVDAGIERRSEVALAIRLDVLECVAENELPVERARQKISNRAGGIEHSPVSEKVVMREPPFDLQKVHCAETGAYARLALGRFLHGDDEHLR